MNFKKIGQKSNMLYFIRNKYILLFIICLILNNCASVDNRLISDSEVIKEFEVANKLSVLHSEKNAEQMIEILNDEERLALNKNDYLKLSYILNEKLYVYGIMLGDLHKEKEIADKLTKYLSFSSSFKNTNYINLPKAVQGKFTSVKRAKSYNYFNQFRNISIKDIRNNLKKREDIINDRLNKDEYQEEYIDNEKANRIASKICKSLLLPLPAEQKAKLYFRYAYALLFSDEKLGLQSLDSALKISLIDLNTSIKQTDYDMVFDSMSKFLFPMQMVKIFQRAGKVATLHNDHNKAMIYTDFSIYCLEKIRTLLKTEEERINFFKRLEILYDRLICLLLPVDKEKALTYVEISKSRVLVDILSDSILKNNRFLANRKSSGKYVFNYYDNLAKNYYYENNEQLNDSRALKVIRRELKEHQKSINDLKENDPEIFSFVGMPIINFDEITDLFDQDHLYLSFYSFKEKNKTILFELKERSLNVHELDLGREELKQMVDDYRHFILSRSGNVDNDRNFVYQNKHHAELCNIFSSIVKGASNNSTIYISPYSALHRFPFSTLSIGDGFLSDYPVSLIPGALSYKHIKNKPKSKTLSIMALGDPLIPNEAKLFFNQLEGAYEEVENIKKYFQDNSKVLLNDKATETSIKHINPTQFSVLHIASHGVFDEYNPMKSHIVLAKDKYNDGFLEANEIIGLDLSNINLVVLSACETGAGIRETGDDVLGLNRSFFISGTSNLISSLWKVDDRATAFFMDKFYEKYSENSTPKQAMVYAYKNTRKQFPYMHHWAAFQLYGTGL